jgi:hypothetical protein
MITSEKIAIAARKSICLSRFGSTVLLYNLPELPEDTGIYYIESIYDHPDPDDPEYEVFTGKTWVNRRTDYLPRTSGGTPINEEQIYIEVLPDVVHFIVGAGVHHCELYVTDQGWFCKGDYLESERCWGNSPRHEAGEF